MSKKYTIILLLILFGVNASAQKAIITGKIIDKVSHLPIKNAVVMMVSEKDSVLQSFVRTAVDGSFQLNDVPVGNSILMVTHPLYADYVDDIKIKSGNVEIPSVSLTNKSKLMEELIIKTGGSIRIKGDTTIYTADSFNVSANANVEELLKKLPGIQIDKNGEIKAMGEKVQKVLVDGEEFFGDDPGMAVKNLRADAVKEVQVFDKKSEQAAFTGIDDGNTQKTINLKLKEDRKRGYFGKVSTAGGVGNNITNRFNNNLMFGSFKGKRKLSAFVLNGNTGQDGLSWQESQKYGTNENSFEMMDEDGIFAMSFNTGNSDEEIQINTENGFIRNINAGIQYSNKWKDNHNLNLSPKYNLQDYSNIKELKTQTQLGDSVLNEYSTVHTNLNRYNLKNTAIYDVKIDTSNSLKLTLRANYYHTESNELTEASTTGKSGTKKNTSDRFSNIKTDKNAYTGNLIFKHKFRKARRTLSLNTDWGNNTTDGENYLTSTNTTFDFVIPDILAVDQLTKNKKNANNISSKLLYTEPLNKKWSMELAYQLSYNTDVNNQTTFTKSIGNNYDNPVDSLTNDFKQNIIVHTPSTRFNYSYKKIKFNFGSGFGITSYDLLDRTLVKDYIRHYTNLFPSASFVYNYKGNHALRIKYNGYNKQPTINQLQPLRNNNNVFNQYIGNPNLKPSFSNNVNITHNGYNFLKNMWNFQSLNVTFNNNAITNNRIINASNGSTISQPINTKGNVNISLWTGVGFKLKKSAINIELSPNANFSRFADVINSLESYSNTTSGGISIGLNKSKADKYDFSLNNDFNYNYNTNAQTKTSNTFKSNTMRLNATVYYKKTWSVISEYQFNARQKLINQTESLNNHFVNIQLQKTFNKNEFTVFAKVRDLFNENIGIDRSYYGNTFTEETNQRLKRYFMLGFSWDFKNKGAAPKK